MSNEPIDFILELMKGKSEEEILEGEQSMRDLVMILAEMADRLVREGVGLKELKNEKVNEQNDEAEDEKAA